MPATTMAHPAAAQSGGKSNAPALIVPFTRAAKEHTETFVDVTQALGAAAVQLGPYDVAAYGFMRGIELLVQATGGSGTASVAVTEDAPWNALAEVALLDVNGAPIVGPISGFDLYLINKYGGSNVAAGPTDPKLSPAYTAPVTGANGSGNFAFRLFVPVEVGARDALGSLANANGASTYKLRITLANAASIYSTAPTTLPSVHLRAILHAWTQPTATDLRGNANAQTPPAHGTTSYWSKTVANLASGQQTPRLPRVGNYIRNLIFVNRDSNGSRANGDGLFPDPCSLYWDTRLLKNQIALLWKDYMQRVTGYYQPIETANGLDKGVFVYDFCHDFDGHLGSYELRDGWLPTVQSTRLELQGQWGGASALTILTNDVSPAGEVFV